MCEKRRSEGVALDIDGHMEEINKRQGRRGGRTTCSVSMSLSGQ